MFTHRNVLREILFVHAAKGAEKVTHAGPHPLGGVDVDFANAITIIIARPFVPAMIDRDMRACNMIQGFRLVVISSGFARNLAGQNEISRSARNDKRKSCDCSPAIHRYS